MDGNPVNLREDSPPRSSDVLDTPAALQAFARLTIEAQAPTQIEESASAQAQVHDHVNARRGSLSAKSSPHLTKRLSTSSMRTGPSPSPSSPHLLPNSRRTSTSLPFRPSSRRSSFTIPPFEDLPSQPRPPARTAASVAAAHFTAELACHAQEEAQTETLVILHEACYGHRFSRPRTTRAALSTIVERPERITAAVLGVAAAYVRLGSRHSGGLHPPGADLEHDIGRAASQEGNKANARSWTRPPFAVRSSRRTVGLLSDPVVTVHGKEWMEELQSMCRAAGARLAVDGRELLRVRKEDSQGKPVTPFHEGDLYLCEESLDALQGAVGGVCDAVDAIFGDALTKRAFVAVRPPGHHCSSDYPSGFCWLNNVHVGIQYAAQTYGLTHAVILDFDLHHGDGSQDITWDRNNHSAASPKAWVHSRKPSIGYYSLHDINSFPCEMGDKAKVQAASLCLESHNQSIWNVHLEPWQSEEDFHKLYESKYRVILDKAKAFLLRESKRLAALPKGGKPKAAVFISAGFDACQWEGAGMQRHGVNVPTSFYERFTRDAVRLAHDTGTAAEGRVISVLEGGYSNRALTSGVLSHIAGLCQSVAMPDVLSNGMVTTPVVEDGTAQFVGDARKVVQTTDPRWWSSSALVELEEHESIEPAITKKVRVGGFMPTFATPTEASMQRAVDPTKLYRSMSGTVRTLPEPLPDLSIPEVSWTVATHALCKLLVPQHRTITSCRAEDLAVARAKKARPSAETTPPPEVVSGGRQLRDRKKATDVLSDDDTVVRQKPLPKTDRRKTLTDVPLANDTVSNTPKMRRTSRRSSVASTADLPEPLPDTVPSVPAIPSAYTKPAVKGASTAKLANVKKTRKSPTKAAGNAEQHRVAPVLSPREANLPVADNSPSRVVKDTSVEPPSLKTESSAGSFATAPSTKGEVEGLASGVKRILIKAPTREQHEQWVKDQLDAEKVTTATSAQRQPRKLAASKTKKFEGDDASAPILPKALNAAPPAQVATFRPAGIANGIVRGTPHSRTTSGSITQPPVAPVTQKGYDGIAVDPVVEPTTRPQAMDISSVLNPTQEVLPATTQPQQRGKGGRESQPTWAARPPSANGRGKDMPAFSSTGHIPFAPSGAPAALMGLPAETAISSERVGLDETSKLRPVDGVAARAVISSAMGASGVLEQAPLAPSTIKHEPEDIWEVPPTPPKR